MVQNVLGSKAFIKDMAVKLFLIKVVNGSPCAKSNNNKQTNEKQKQNPRDGIKLLPVPHKASYPETLNMVSLEQYVDSTGKPRGDCGVEPTGQPCGPAATDAV